MFPRKLVILTPLSYILLWLADMTTPRLLDGWVLLRRVTKTPTLNEILDERKEYVRHVKGKISEAGSSIPCRFAEFIVGLSELLIKFGHVKLERMRKWDCIINVKIWFNYEFVLSFADNLINTERISSHLN